MKDMKIIGITGGIGAGKSIVSRVLRCKGFQVYDCDSEAREIMEHSDDLKQEICKRFGVECVLPDGSLARDIIASHIFSDDAKRLWLNQVVHALVREDIINRIEAIRREISEAEYETLFFIESAILKTSGLTGLCDEVWLVEAQEDLRIKRACARDNADRNKITARIRSQQHEFEGFGAVSMAVIVNDDDSYLLNQINALIN